MDRQGVRLSKEGSSYDDTRRRTMRIPLVPEADVQHVAARQRIIGAALVLQSVRLAAAQGKSTVAKLVEAAPELQWQRLSAGAGAKGPRWYEWASIPLLS